MTRRTLGGSLPLIAIAIASPATAQDEDQPLFGMEEVVVTGTASKERTKYESSVAISTFDSAEIEKRAPASTADLISAVPGFWVESTSGTTQGNVFARGIIQDGGYKYVGLMEDGIPIFPVFELSFYNPDQFIRVDTTIDRVEAVRGGTSPIFTSGAVGGTINFVTRSPGEVAEGDVKLTLGDYGLYRVDGFWGGPLSDDWGLALGGYYRSSDGIRDPGYTADEGGQLRVKLVRQFDSGDLALFAKYINDKSLFVVPVPLTGNPSDPDGIAGADPGEYSLHSRDLAAAGLPPSAAQVGLQGSDLEDGIHPDLFTIGGKLTWDLTPTVTLTETLRYTDGEVRFDGIFPGAAAVTGNEFAAALGVAPNYTVINSGAAYDPTRFVQNHGHWVVNKEYEALQNDIRLSFLLGGHDLTLGFYFADYSMADRWSLGNLLLMDASDQPNRLFLPGATSPDGFTQFSFFNLLTDYDATKFALYVSDEWQVTDALRLDFGLRYDDDDIDAAISSPTTVDFDGDPATTFDSASIAGAPVPRDVPGFDDLAFSVGFNYELSDIHAFFGHYTEAARLPHFDDIRVGTLVKDGVTNVELGYKTNLSAVGMFVTLFQTEFDNVTFNDILADGSVVVRQAETRTRGIEVEGTWQPAEAFGLYFSVTLQDPVYEDFTGGTFDNTGNQIRRIPETMARLTPTYYFPNGRGEAFLTWSYFDDRFANDENTIVLPSYNKLDFGILYDITDALTVQLNVDNITDEVGLTEGNPRTDVGAGGIGAVYNARPLFGTSFTASATYRF